MTTTPIRGHRRGTSIDSSAVAFRRSSGSPATPAAPRRAARRGQPHPSGVRGLSRWEDHPRDADVDALTGLLDARAFRRRLQDEFLRGRRSGASFTLAILDLDAFDAVNAAVGYAEGDRVLARFAAHLGDFAIRPNTIGRLGPDRFGWILHGVDSAQALRVLQAVAGEAEGAVPHLVGVSSGVAYSEAAATGPLLVRHAERALGEAKRAGGGTVIDASWLVHEPRCAPGSVTRPSAFLPALRALARAVDARDPATIRHSLNVADLAERLAERLGWDPVQRARLRLAAELHDVGKASVHQSVLLAPGALTPSQRAEMQHHAATGAAFVAGALDGEQVGWVRHHHERWDGGGYPDGLAGDQIPLGARILAVADAVDAMTSGRRYQGRRAVALAHDECRACSGSQFDPMVVALLSELGT